MGPMDDGNFQSLSSVNLPKARTASENCGFATSCPIGSV